MKELKILLLGFGNASQAFCKLLIKKLELIKKEYGITPKVVGIATATKGNIINENGFEITSLLDDVKGNGYFKQTLGITEISTLEMIRTVDYDVMIEMTPLDIETGQPAISHIKEAFKREKHVITANKGPIAWEFKNLNDLAKELNLGFFYETTVMDGAPVFNLYEKTLKLSEVIEVSGILNTTTNYILESMEKNIPHDEILKSGKELGFVEANPDMDIKGYDAAAKITALVNVLMKGNITPKDVKIEGIENIDYDDIKEAEKKGEVFKLFCRGFKNQKGKICAEVKPIKVKKDEFLATIDGTTSVVSITTDTMKKISVVEHLPEIEQTAYGIFGDLIRVIEFIANRR